MIANTQPRSRHFPVPNFPVLNFPVLNFLAIYLTPKNVAGILGNRDRVKLRDLDIFPEPTVEARLRSELVEASCHAADLGSGSDRLLCTVCVGGKWASAAERQKQKMLEGQPWHFDSRKLVAWW